MSEQLSEKKAERSALAAERESSLRSRSDLQQLQEDMRGGCDEQERLMREMREAIEKAKSEITARRSRVEALQQQGAALRETLSGLARQKMELEAKRSTADRESRECNDTLLNCEREVARLEQKGMVEGLGSPEDRRVKMVRITSAGRECCRFAQRDMEETEQRLLSGLTETEQSIFLSLLKKVRDTL